MLEKPLGYRKLVGSYQTTQGTELSFGPEVGLFSSNVHIHGIVKKMETEEGSVCAVSVFWGSE